MMNLLCPTLTHRMQQSVYKKYKGEDRLETKIQLLRSGVHYSAKVNAERKALIELAFQLTEEFLKEGYLVHNK